MSANTDRIRALNDELRQHLLGGGAVMTPGIAALGQEAVQRLVQNIATFDDFCTANVPTASMILGHLNLMVSEYFSKLTTTTRASTFTPRTLLIPPSLSG